MGQRPPSAPVHEGHEVEVKFRTDAVGLQRALASPLLAEAASTPLQNLRSIYFDTASGDLRHHGIVLRLRKKGRNGAVQGIKSANHISHGPFRRREIEVRSPDLVPNLALFDQVTAAELFHLVGNRPLLPQFETLVKRRSVGVHDKQCQIEVAFDDGCIVVDGKEVPLIEVELELKQGSEAALCDFALKFAEGLPLRLDFVSKSERGFRVRAQESAPPVLCEPVRLVGTATLDDAVAEVVANTLAHFVANWAALRETDHPEAIHQMRVALRRMRSAFSMFKLALPCAEFDLLGSEAKRIAAVLGPARECDAFAKNAEQGPLADANHPASCQAMLEALQAHRSAAYATARALIEAPATTAFVLKVQRFLACKTWQDAGNNAELLAQPARKFARGVLRKLHARVLKRGQGLRHISDQDRHKLRIALKNLRYGAEFFGSLFNRQNKLKAYVDGISKLQDLLGTHNDGVTARKLLAELSEKSGAPIEAASGFMLGWHARSIPITDENLHKRWKKFKRATPP